MVLVLPSVVWADDKDKPLESGNVFIGTARIDSCKYGEEATIELPLVNNERMDVINVVVEPVQNESAEVYPFTIKKTNIFKKAGSIPKGQTDDKSFHFNFKVRKDVVTKEYPVQFLITYAKNTGTQENPVYRDVRYTKTIYVQVTGESESEVEPTATPTPEETNTDGEGDSGTDDSGDSYTGSGSSSDSDSDSDDAKKTGTPRVIVDGFRTEPQTINAGETFKLILKVRNTSKKTAVSNMEINLEAAGSSGSSSSSSSDSDDDGVTATTASDVFMPVKGSNTLFVNSIGVDKTQEVEIDLTARADLTQKPYQLSVSMKYEDSSAQQYESASSISIPIKQKARFDLSTISVEPESIMVGEEGSITFSIYNKGRTKLYNVSVEMKSDTITGGDAFVGNLEAGATGNVDLMVTGVQETTDEGEVKISITYEDQDGNSDSYEATCNLFVMPESQLVDGMMEDMQEEDTSGGVNLWMILGIVGAAIVVMGIVIAILIKRKHKKEEDFADEIFGSDKDE